MSDSGWQEESDLSDSSQPEPFYAEPPHPIVLRPSVPNSDSSDSELSDTDSSDLSFLDEPILDMPVITHGVGVSYMEVDEADLIYFDPSDIESVDSDSPPHIVPSDSVSSSEDESDTMEVPTN